MKKLAAFLLIICLSACATNRTYIRDYNRQMELIELHFPTIYQLYCNGIIIIDDVYTYEKDGRKLFHVDYHYRN